MGACDRIAAYLDGQLEATRAARFEAHLEDCDECRRAVEAWREIAARIVDVSAADSTAVDPSAHEALLLVQRAELERDQPSFGIARIALAATVLLALGGALGYWLAGPSAVEPELGDPVPGTDAAQIYHTDSRSRTAVRLGDDTIHLGPASRVEVVRSGPETRLALRAGSLACEVAGRTVAGAFFVEASGFSVRVTGTRFLVDLGSGEEPARVVVAAGAVEVRGPAVGVHSLGSGERLALGARPRALPASATELAAIDRLFDALPTAGEVVAGTGASTGADEADPEEPRADAAPVAPIEERAGTPVLEPDQGTITALERWRGWVIEGRLDEARFALRAHLADRPKDAAAWSLLASCERKRASWEDAVAAYEKTAALSGAEQANRARYQAALILQDRLGDHGRAAELLERFLEGGGGGSLLVDKARVRLARSLVVLGQRDRARRQLRRVIEGAADGQTVATAKQMLERLEQE